MLVGYVSDERYVAIADVLVEFDRGGECVAVMRSTPRGAVYADLAPGTYVATLVKEGYGPKHAAVTVGPGEEPHQFRLLSNRLIGYMWPRWSRAGEQAQHFVHSVEPYRLSLWRYGARAEFVRLLGWYDEHGPNAVMQITPDGDYTQTGVRWNTVGYGPPDATRLVTAPERSGLYYLHAKGESGAFFSFPWVVAPRSPQAPIAVLASTNTWNAYNNFGGRSNYINAHRLPPTPAVNARQELDRYQQATFNVWRPADAEYAPLSFQRPEPGNIVPEGAEPTDPIAGRLTSHLAPGEWRFLAWLEREGYSYDFYAEHHLHTGALDLDAYRILAITVHPEYWSRDMFRRVKEWVFARGGRLMYLGGNGINCEVEFLDDATLRFKTQLLAEGGRLGMVDPDDPSIFYDSRFHRTYEPEASLLGVVTTAEGIMTAAPYQVRDAAHWAFAGTGLSDGDLFGEASLHERVHGGASGHETDKMSPHSPPGTLLLAKGTNPDEGGAEMVYHETASGGAVFSVGSITYPSSLLVDPAVSRITANVINRFLRGPADEDH